jgi:predicted ester cyclase
MSESSKAVCRRLIDEVVNQGNLTAVDELVSPSYVYHGPGGLELRGIDGFKQLVTLYRTAYPDLRITIDDIVAEGETVAMRWTGRGTHLGDLSGIAPTARPATVTGIVFSRVVGGKIVEDFESFDELGMLRQLGVTTIPTAAHA